MTTTSITVAFPVEIEGRTIAEVSIRRPKVKDLRTLDQAHGRDAGDIGQGIFMASLLTGLPIEAMDELEAADFEAISEVIAGLLPQAKAPADEARGDG